MNITLRPSRGRGEYELAGRQGNLRPQDVYGLAMFIEVLPGMAINAQCHCVSRDRKSRIRLTRPARDAHPSALIAAAMMLPKPRRERHRTHGTNLIREGEFVVQTVRIDIVPQANRVLVRPVTVRLENADGVRLDINFAERMARVVRVWTAAATIQDSVALAVRSHAAVFSSLLTTQVQLASAMPAVQSALGNPDGDPLPLLEAHFGLGLVSGPSAGDLSAELSDSDFAENVVTNPFEARVERLQQWRLATIRGASAARFRRDVRDAYDSRCLFSGRRLPRTEVTSTAGVDAAHILPWRTFDLDTVPNGICLNKECHWAFDQAVLRLIFDEAVNAYVVSIPDSVRRAAVADRFDLGSFEPVTGVIPAARLPRNLAQWPSREYLSALYGFLDDDDWE
jgi:NADPH-dependent ferric siderophore reductase